MNRIILILPLPRGGRRGFHNVLVILSINNKYFMEKKVQYKFQVEDDFKNKVKVKNVEFGPAVKYAYIYFEVPNTNDNFYSILRIKKSQGVQKLDMKIRDNKTGEWEHFESDIQRADQVQSILERLGYLPIFTFHKYRQTWKNEFIRFDLDTTKELGMFLEVKFNLSDKRKVDKFLQEFGIDSSKHDKRSVIEIYKEKYRKIHVNYAELSESNS